MDYSNSYFNKDLNELSVEDVENYFQKDRSETDQIEFKSIHPQGELNENFKSIQRTVCAFLNSSGGLIIWGAPEGQKPIGRKEKIFQGSLTFFSKKIEKDYIVSKISDGIITLPQGIRVRVLENSGKSIVIIEVDSSEYSPHQTGNIYYMRIDGQTKPAPHHYIEALFKKIKYPELEAMIRVRGFNFIEDNQRIIIDIIFTNWSPLQNEEKLTFRVLTDGIFEASKGVSYRKEFTNSGHEFYSLNEKEVFYYGEPVIVTQAILFNQTDLGQKDNKARIMVSFAGRFSPRKSSEYTLDFGKGNVDDPNTLIVEKKENRLVKDVHSEKGMNKENIIKTLMEIS